MSRATQAVSKRELRQQRHARGECVDCERASGKYWRCLQCRHRLNTKRHARKAKR